MGSKGALVRLEELPINEVLLDQSVELRFDYDVKDLAEDIRMRGQLQPVLAYRKDGKYYIFVGMRRYYAIKYLYETYGEPKTIKALVYPTEPSLEEKLEMALSENEKRNELNIYEKIAVVITHKDQAEKVMSKNFVRSVKLLLTDITVEKLKRWYEIEKKLGGVKLKFAHLNRIAQLPPDVQDFAVFFFHEFNIAEYADVSDFKRLVLNTPLTTEQKQKLEMLNLKNPFEGERAYYIPSAPSAPAEEESAFEGWYMGGEELEKKEEEAEELKPSIEEKPPEIIRIREPEEIEKPRTQALELEERRAEHAEEERERTLLMSESVQTMVVNGKVYVFYAGDKEPEVKLVRVEDGQEVEIEGVKHKVRLLL